MGNSDRRELSIDIETYSSEDLTKSGVYRYAEAPDFAVLLFGYSVDGGPVQVVDIASGEKIPSDIIAALKDPSVMKWAFNTESKGSQRLEFCVYGPFAETGGFSCSKRSGGTD